MGSGVEEKASFSLLAFLSSHSMEVLLLPCTASTSAASGAGCPWVHGLQTRFWPTDRSAYKGNHFVLLFTSLNSSRSTGFCCCCLQGLLFPASRLVIESPVQTSTHESTESHHLVICAKIPPVTSLPVGLMG